MEYIFFAYHSITFRFKIYKNGDLIYTENKGDPKSVQCELKEWLLGDQVLFHCP